MKQRSLKMKLNEIITTVQNMRPSEFSAEQLTDFLNEVENAAIDRVFNMAIGGNVPPVKYDYNNDAEKELMIPDQFSGVYLTYLFAKIDFFNAEPDRYNMDAAAYESEWHEFASWYRRNNMPKEHR